MCFISVLGEVFHSPMFSQSVYLLTTFIYDIRLQNLEHASKPYFRYAPPFSLRYTPHFWYCIRYTPTVFLRYTPTDFLRYTPTGFLGYAPTVILKYMSSRYLDIYRLS